ncbi:hypothetical protein AMECASPLE_001193 [Ameca splendens]|uniref:Uncharacterized protein n=1 Tax=Ameca splendens TaxID=208324 RepID=A0ABV0ZTT3_9TELE
MSQWAAVILREKLDRELKKTAQKGSKYKHRDDRGKALLLRVCIDRGPSEGGGWGTRRAGPFSMTAAPPLLSTPSPSACSPARSEFQI